jgi:isopentenyl diphosphate isomerase/L-lactate dehydrogenase-like FMN-dependent dehydrogenase
MKISPGRRLPALACVPALAAALGLSACGSFDSKASGESLLKSWVPKGLSQYVGQPLVLKSVSCPSGVKNTAGATFSCKITLAVKGSKQARNGTATIHMQTKTVEVAPSDIHLT